MDGFGRFDFEKFEVDSVADLWVTVLDESTVEEGVVDTQLVAGSAVGSVARFFSGN